MPVLVAWACYLMGYVVMVSGLRLFLMTATGIWFGFLLLGQAAFAVELGDKEKGRKLFKLCKNCHQIGQGAKNRIGPHLNLLFGRKAASIDGFRYSKGIKRAAAGGLEWHADTLSAYLENPKNLVSGTRMNFAGMKDLDQRMDLIAYLRLFSDNPADIPEADPTISDAGHDLDPAILALKGDPDYGDYLSGECTACHQTSGQDDGVPSIVAWPEDDFVRAMHAYKKQVRQHPVMQMIAGRLSDDEIASLAAFFANIKE